MSVQAFYIWNVKTDLGKWVYKKDYTPEEIQKIIKFYVNHKSYNIQGY